VHHVRKAASAHRTRSALPRLRPAEQTHGLLALQRLGGNRAVTSMLQQTVQRDGPTGQQPANTGAGRSTQVTVPLPLPSQFDLSPWLLARGGTGAPAQTGGGSSAPAQQTGGAAPPATQQTGTPPPTTAQTGGTPAPATTQTGGTPPAQTGAPPAATQTGQQPAAAEGGDQPRFGMDVTLGGSANMVALDTVDPSNLQAPPHRLQLRAPDARAGDFGVNGALAFVWRDKNFRNLSNGWHLLHEPTITIGAAYAPNALGGALTPGVSIGADIFHRQVSTAIGQLDFHALQTQIYGNLGIPLQGETAGMPNDMTAGFGAGVGTGVELHPGSQNRFSVAAYLAINGGGTTDLSNGNTTFGMAATANIVFTGNIIGP
jgi:hypothetical protein